MLLRALLDANELTPNEQVTQTHVNDTIKYAQGYQQFRELFYKPNEKEFLRLVEEGQNPRALVISCSDSRTPSDFILGTKPGTVFGIRTAGNFVPQYDVDNDDGVSATIQYAVEVLKVKNIIVCGHSHCGAIKGLFEKLDPIKLGLLKKWLEWGEGAKRMTMLTLSPTATPTEKYRIAERISIIYQLDHLMTYPFIKKKVLAGEIALHGWYFKIETGEIDFYDPQKFTFIPLSSLAVPGIEKEGSKEEVALKLIGG